MWLNLMSELKENKTEFIPVDSEHFSIWYGLRNNKDFIKNIYITASEDHLSIILCVILKILLLRKP